MTVLTYNDLFIADPNDGQYPLAPTGRVFTFNDLEANCDATGFGIADPIFTDNYQEVRIGSASGGDMQAAHGYAAGTFSFRLFWKGVVVSDLYAQVLALSTLCDNGGVLGWQPKGLDAVRYIDFDSSGWPQIFAGQTQQLYRVTGLLTSPDGMLMQIITAPFMRLAPVTIEPVSLSNNISDRELIVVNPGNRPSPVRWEVAPTHGTLAEVRFSVRDRGNLTEYATKYSFDPSTGTNYLDTSDTTVFSNYYIDDDDLTEAGTDGVEITFAAAEDNWRRFRKVINISDPTTLQGRHRLFVVMRADGDPTNEDDRSEFKVQARYGYTDADLALTALPQQYSDWRDIDHPHLVCVDLGDIIVGRVEQLVIDFYASRLSGNQHLVVTQLLVMPTTWQTTVLGVPGWRAGSWGHEKWDAEELVGTGVFRRQTYRLNNNGEEASARPIRGRELPVGNHKVTCDVTLKEPDDNSDRRVMARFQIIEDPDVDGNGAVRKEIRLWTHRNMEHTRKARSFHFNVTAADAAANRKFGIRIRHAAANQPGRGTYVHTIHHSFLEGVSRETPLTVDGYARRAYAHPLGINAEIFGIALEGDPPLAPPGNSAWVWDFRSTVGDPGYQDIDPREPLAPIKHNRPVTVSGIIVPRVTH